MAKDYFLIDKKIKMRRKFTFFLFLLICFIGCNKSPVEKPNNLIEEDKMVAILTDLSLFESIRNQNGVSTLSEYNPNDYIYKKYKIDSLQFLKSNKYYASDVTNYRKMYKKVLEKLDQYQKEIEPSQINKDSKK